MIRQTLINSQKKDSIRRDTVLCLVYPEAKPLFNNK